MIVDQVPPTSRPGAHDEAYDGWIAEIVAAYGPLKSSMLFDLELGRSAEVDFINGYVAGGDESAGIALLRNAVIIPLLCAPLLCQ